VRTPAPGFGESTRDILKDLGYSDTQIDSFSENGVM